MSSPTAVQLAQLAAAGADVLYILTGQRSSAQPAHDAAEQVLLDSYRRQVCRFAKPHSDGGIAGGGAFRERWRRWGTRTRN